jgi:Outer membrane protein beta-barrel domain
VFITGGLMKNILFILAFVISLSGTAFSQNKMTELNVGLLAPTDAESGFFGGINLGRMVDEKIGISLGIHVYHSSYTKESKVGEDNGSGQIETSQTATELDQSATLIPLFFQIHYTGPITQVLDLKVTAGLGYEFLWNSITNFKEGKERTDFFSGFGWNVSAGVSIPISSASDFYGEVLYHGGTPSTSEGKTDEGLPLRTEVDMSGIGIRIGLRLYSFGI